MYVCACVLQVLSPTYKSRSEDFKRIFKDIPNTERLIVGEFTGVVVRYY